MELRKKFYSFVLPSMLAFALSGVYAIVDGFFVGNSLGDDGLAAISLAYPLTAFIQSLGTGIGMGGAVNYSISEGEGRRDLRNEFFKISFILLLSAGVFSTLLLIFGSSLILHAFGARGAVFELSKEYIDFIIYGAIFQILATGLIPFIRNMQGAVFAMFAMITGFVTNIVLDWLLVWYFPFGMAGAAVATDIGQSATFLLCAGFILFKKREVIKGAISDFRHHAKKVLLIAPSPFGLAFVPNVTLILINKSASSYGGDAALSCYAAIAYISSVIFLLLQGISDGTQPLLSLYHGEKRYDLTRIIRGMAFRFSAAVAVVIMIVVFLLRDRAGILFGASEEIVHEIGHVLPIFIVGYIFVSFSRIVTSYFYAIGNHTVSYVLIYGEPALLLVLLFVIPPMLGITGTWISVPISQVAVMLLSLAMLRYEKKLEEKAEKGLSEDEEEPGFPV